VVSREHGNFIVNQGGATAADVAALARAVQEEVALRHGIELVPEIRLIDAAGKPATLSEAAAALAEGGPAPSAEGRAEG
jgi:UDP-N-acetylmuramate dehydrogenase